MISAVLSAAFLLFPAESSAQPRAPRRNVIESLTEALSRDPGFTPQERSALMDAVSARFAAYGLEVVRPGKAEGIPVVLRMMVEGHFDDASWERIADVSFAAYQAISRGAPAEVVEGIALYGYRKKIPGERIGVWANGYHQMTQNGIPGDIGADLVRLAMENDWEDSTFNSLKWSLVEGRKEKFNLQDYAVYLFGNMLKGKRRPGELGAAAKAYFRKLARTKAKPELPDYEGAFNRKPRRTSCSTPSRKGRPRPRNRPLPNPRRPLRRPRPRAARTNSPKIRLSPSRRPAPGSPGRPQSSRKTRPAGQADPPVEKPSAHPAGQFSGPHARRNGHRMTFSQTGSFRETTGDALCLGGATRKGIDCSALTQTYGENKVGIPRVSRQQWATGKKIEWSDLREGDLVFFNTMGVGVSHVGMLVSRNGTRFIHASSSRGVVADDLSKRYYKSRYLGARRIVP